MFAIPGKQAVSITDRAAAQISKLMAKDGHQGLRIGIKKGGCAGMEYTMEYVDEVAEHDEVVEQDGARVMIAPMAQMFLFGTQIDYEVSLLESGFKFKNPNVTEACGCGESIKFADVDELTAATKRVMAASDAQIAFLQDLFAGLGPLSLRKMFGGLGIYRDGTIFAVLLSDGSLRLKGAGDMAETCAAEGWEQWSYTRKNGAPSGMPYWTLPDHLLDDPDAACAWARRALKAL